MRSPLQLALAGLLLWACSPAPRTEPPSDRRAERAVAGPPMSVARVRHAAALLTGGADDGKLVVTGGEASGDAGVTSLAITELYSSGAWSPASPLGTPRRRTALVALPGGDAIVLGGLSDAGTALSTTERFRGGSWSPHGDLAAPRADHFATLLATGPHAGKILVLGGTAAGGTLSTVEAYDPTDGTSTPLSPMSRARRDFAAAAVVAGPATGRVVVAGGCADFGCATLHSTAEVFDPVTLTWTDTATSLGAPRRALAAVGLSDGRVLLLGGRSGPSLSNAADAYDPATNTFASVADMPRGRLGHTATLLPNGHVLVAGAEPGALEQSRDYDPVADSWTGLGAPPVPRYFATATRLPNGAVAVVGGGQGFNGFPPVASMDLYALLPDGAACAVGAECFSGFCADGTCCDTACAGVCVACTAALKASGTDGVCGPLRAGDDPEDECTQQAVSSCGTDGACDGAGACRRYAAGTTCGAAPRCVGNASEPGDVCDGAGTCATASPVPCAPHACDAVSGSCPSSCAADGHCAQGNFCATAGACEPLRATGEACVSARECATGFCEDAVCCNSACSGSCMACTGSKKGSGSDGTCGPVGEGEDPDAECAASPPCGRTGSCDGNGSCGVEASGAPCGEQRCDGNAAVPSECDGNGACVERNAIACAPFVCRAGGCLTRCDTTDDCADGNECGGAGACVPSTGECTDATTFLSAAGATDDCAPYTCSPSGCRDSCATSAECAAGSVCDTTGGTGVCSTAADAPPGDEGGCGCRVPTAGRAPGTILLVLVALGVARVRRTCRSVRRARSAAQRPAQLRGLARCAIARRALPCARIGVARRVQGRGLGGRVDGSCDHALGIHADDGPGPDRVR